MLNKPGTSCDDVFLYIRKQVAKALKLVYRATDAKAGLT